MAKRFREQEVLLKTLLLSMILSYSLACPPSCYCFDVFVTCSDFKSLNLTLLPPDTDTLVISRGEMEEIPSGFLPTATNLKMLEISALSAKVVRSKAFAGLSHLDVFSITSSFFGVVESESFSGMNEVSKFHISDSAFGKVNQRAFANINNVVDFKIWSSSFDVIGDEAFHNLKDILSLQIYENNITSLGDNIFLGSSGIDDITFYKNNIHRISEESLEKVNTVTSRMVVHANTFACLCDIAWSLEKPSFKEYLATNECIFPNRARNGESKFRMADVTRDDLCPAEDVSKSTPGTLPVVPEIIEEVDIAVEEFVSEENLRTTTSDFEESTFSFHSTSSPLDFTRTKQPQLSSSLASSSLSSSSAAAETTVYSQPQEASMSAISSSPDFSEVYSESPSYDSASTFSSILSSDLLSSTSSAEETFSQTDELSVSLKTDPQIYKATDIENYERPTTAAQKMLVTEGHSAIEISERPGTVESVVTGDLEEEGRFEPVHEPSVDAQGSEQARSYGTSADSMSTTSPDNASYTILANSLFIISLSGLTLMLMCTS